MLSWLVSIVILFCILAVIVILGRWIIGLTGATIPQPLMVVLGIILFLFFVVWLLKSGPFINLRL